MMSRRDYLGVKAGWPLLALAGLVVLLAACRAPAQSSARPAGSLELVPDNALFYSAMLRNREQLEMVLKSKAWAKLSRLPALKMLRNMIDQGLAPNPGLAKLKDWYEQEENRKLIGFLGDMCSDEIFCYGGRDSADFYALLSELQGAYQYAPLMALLSGKNPQEAANPETRIRIVLQTLAQNTEHLKAPDLVVGFKLRDTQEAKAQLKRLDRLVKNLIRQQPQFQGRWTKAKVAGGEYYTLRLDGRLVPWDQIPLSDLEEKQGEFEPLKKKLREMVLSVSIGLRGSYLIVAVGDSPARLKELGGAGNKLADRPEFKRLAKFADRRLTAISYSSKQWRSLLEGSRKDLKNLGDKAIAALESEGIELTAKQKTRLRDDLNGFAKDFKKYVPNPGAYLSFSFLNARGSESYSYDWTKEPLQAESAPLQILRHVGGSPLGYYAERSIFDPEAYRLLVKWIKIGWGDVEDLALPKLPEEVRDKYAEIMKIARPLLVRLDRVTGKMLLPGLGTGEDAVVLDARLTSKQWHQAMPESEKALPLPAPALVMSVKNAELLRKAGAEYRKILNEVIAQIGQTDFQLPPPQAKEYKGGTLYSYPLPEEAGLDRHIEPTAALNDHWLVLSISPIQARRLLLPTPLAEKATLPGAPKAVLSAAYFNWAGFVRAAEPWVDYALLSSGAEDRAQDVRGQVHTVLEVVRVLRSYASVTYPEGDAVVTHGETIIRDIK
jgi:hypothetical protein